MKAPKKKPFTISRQPSSQRVPSSGEGKSPDSPDQPSSRALVTVSGRDSQIEMQNQILASQTIFKNCYNLFKVSPSLLPELLQKYAMDNLKYRDEEFTQQADNFLTKIAASKKIPKDLRAKYPLYYILVSICKIFMLNEYEIIVLACALDNCGWKINETVRAEEAMCLREFPGNLGPDIDDDCKRLIIYLLVITFSLKQYINEKGEVDKIHAYCENICTNFEAIFNRWTRVSYYHKFNYSPLEINRKFRYLSKKEEFDPSTALKDYNMVVDSIMTLTGSYKAKANLRPTSVLLPQIAFQQQTFFPTFQLPPTLDTKPLVIDTPTLSAIPMEKSVSRQQNFEFSLDGYELPEVESLSRQTSSSNLYGEERGRKKAKFNTFGNFKESLTSRDFAQFSNNNFRNYDLDDYFGGTPLPSLSKRSSAISQGLGDEQSLYRFSNLMAPWDKEKSSN